MPTGDSPPYREDVQHAQVGIGEVERLYREQGGRLWAAVFGYAHDRGVADDAVAEAFAQLLRRGGDVRDHAAWVWTSAFRLAAGELQRRRTIVQGVPESWYEPELADARILAAVSKAARASAGRRGPPLLRRPFREGSRADHGDEPRGRRRAPVPRPQAPAGTPGR